MTFWIKQNSTIFFVGFTAFTVALAYGVLADSLFSTLPLPFVLRGLGIGFMLGGLALWAADTRAQAEATSINPLIGVLVGLGVLSLLVALFLTATTALGPLVWAGLAVNGIALLIAFLAMVINPAYPEPITTHWPEGGEPEPVEHHHDETHDAQEPEPEPEPEPVEQVTAQTAPPEPQDLTKIEGIGPKLKSILHAAGILTFADLAQRDPAQITELVKEAGFKAPFKADTWPEQAALAAEGNWDQLQTLQDDLQGGRRS